MRYDDKAWTDSMRIRFDYNGMMTDYIGEYGISESAIQALEDSGKLMRVFNNVQKERSAMKWRELPYISEEEIDEISEEARRIGESCDAFVVLGIGGSALGPIAVHNALTHMHYNELKSRKYPRFYVEDNIDPERLSALFDIIDPKKTIFNVITKSGSTSETMSQLLIVTDYLKAALGDDFASRIIATTDSEKGNLRKIANTYGMRTFTVPEGVGGRFSELCAVGLLPAAVCGIDIKEMLAGAAYMDKLTQNPDFRENPAYMAAILQFIAMNRGCNIHALMPYSDRLKYFADWYAQLLGESLGKKHDRKGREVHVGQTPVKALGVTDQHSQIQLYTEGPFDKMITFIGVDKYGAETFIPHAYDEIPDVAFLSGHTQNELIAAELFATEYAVAKSGHMSSSITLPEINAFTVGELIYMLEMQIAYAGELLNIDAFDQPGVEEGKNATYALLNKKGYDEKRKELASARKKLGRYIIK